MTKTIFIEKPVGFVVMHTCFWWLMIIIAKCNLDLNGDMVEVYSWSQHWLMGSDKHPQFLPWMAKLWFMAAPRTSASFYLLAAINMCVGLVGIYALGRKLTFTDQEMCLVLVLCVLGIPYLTLAAKLNMNAISLSTWPWTAWAFLTAAKANNNKQRVGGIISFSILGAICILGKYYSAVFLFTLFVSSLMKEYRHIYLTITPYAAAVLMLIILTPHFNWLIENNFATFTYAYEHGDSSIHFQRLASFALTPMYYWGVPWGIALIYLYTGSIGTRIAHSVRFRGKNAFLWYLAVLPWAFTLAAGAIGNVRLSEPWAIPIGLSYSMLVVGNADKRLVADVGSRIVASFIWFWPAMIIGGFVFALFHSINRSPTHYLPEYEIVDRILAEWESVGAGRKLSWASSPDNTAARLAYYAPAGMAPEALPDFPDQLPGYYPVRPNWRNESGVYICPLGRIKANNSMDARKTNSCVSRSHSWGMAHNMKTHTKFISLAKYSWRHYYDVPYGFVVVFLEVSTLE